MKFKQKLTNRNEIELKSLPSQYDGAYHVIGLFLIRWERSKYSRFVIRDILP